MKTTTTQQKLAVVKQDNHLSHLKDDLWSQMLFRNVKSTDDIKVQIHAFSESICLLLKRYDELKILIEAAIDAMLFHEGNYGDRQELLQIAKEAVMQHVPEFSISIPDLLGWELAEYDDEELWEYLRDSLDEQIKTLAHTFQSFLDEAVMSNVFGIVEWKKGKRLTCRYSYFQARIIQNAKSKSERERKYEENRAEGWFHDIEVKTVTRDLHQRLVLSRFEHHLYTTSKDVWPAPKVPKPKYVVDLMAKVPTWLSKHIYVVSGDMCKEVQKNHDAWEKNWTEVEVHEKIVRQGRLYSPALVFGETVLAGWSDSDLKS